MQSRTKAPGGQTHDSAEQDSEARPCAVSPASWSPVFCEPNQVPGNQGRCVRAVVGAQGTLLPRVALRWVEGSGEQGAGCQALEGNIPAGITFSISCLSLQTETSVAQPQAPAMSSFLFSLDW